MRYRFGVFEVDSVGGELRRNGLRAKLHTQPFQLLLMLIERPGEILTREEICQVLWPEGTFVDYEHGVNSAVNRLREALGDKAGNPRFIETLARKGYRFVGSVERIGEALEIPQVAQDDGFLSRVLAAPEELPKGSGSVARMLFLLLQAMYLGFYIGALANLTEIGELVSGWPFVLLVSTAAALIPVRAFLLCAVMLRAPGLRGKYLRIWPFLLVADVLWSLAPFLLLHHISYGLALACTALLVYSPFAQRSLALMGE